MVFFNFSNFFAFFFGIFYSGWGRKDRNNKFFFSLSRPVPTRFGLKLGLNGVFNFFCPFYGIFYSRSCRKDRSNNFFFLSFSTCPDPFWLEMKPELCILIFCIFLLFFSEFSILGRVGRIGTIIFFFSHSRPVLTRFGFK